MLILGVLGGEGTKQGEFLAEKQTVVLLRDLFDIFGLDAFLPRVRVSLYHVCALNIELESGGKYVSLAQRLAVGGNS